VEVALEPVAEVVEFEPGPEPAPAPVVEALLERVLPEELLMMLELPVPRGTELEVES
jgi:hypothetical protein